MSGITKKELEAKLQMRNAAYASLEKKYNEMCEDYEPMRIKCNAAMNLHGAQKNQIDMYLQQIKRLYRIIAAQAEKIHGGV
jgi:hypothetical protein